MKHLLIIILLFLFSISSSLAQQAEKLMDYHVKQVSFGEFCNLVYKQTSIKVFYKNDQVTRLKVSLDADNITALAAVSKVLEGSGLQVSVWQGNLVVLKGEQLLSSLPSYNTNENNNTTIIPEATAITESEEKYMTGRKADAIQILYVGHKGGSITDSKAKLSGRILDEDSGEPVIYATIFIEETKTGVASDLNGFVSLALKPGTYNARLECLGYKKKKYQIVVLSDGDFNVSIKKSVVQMEEVVVYGDRQMSMRLKDPGLEKLTGKSIRSIPMLMGERDILKVSQMLPGIVNVGEGSAGLNVRGGGSDQNAFYLNKIPIYNTSHLFGFFPAFNADIIKDFSIYKGYVPAQYGGRLSSVFNIITRQGNRKRFMARGGISPVAANIVLEGPLKKDVGSILLSARSSYSNWLLTKIKDPVISDSKALFNDFSGSVNYDLKKSQVSLFGYYSNDKFELSDINKYTYSNGGISLNISHNYNNVLHAEYALIASQYSFTTTDNQEVSAAYEHAYKIGQYEGRADFTHVVGDKHTLEYGADLIFYLLDRGNLNPHGSESLRIPVQLGKEQASEGSLYLSDNFRVLPWLSINAGLRYSMYVPTGPNTVYTYAPGEPVDASNITDSIVFGNNEPIKWYGTPQIRTALNMETDKNGSVKLSFNQMTQNLFMLSNTISIAPNTQWKLADYHLAPSKNNQFSLGVFRNLPKLFLEASAEVYYKYTTNTPEFKDGADFLNNPHLETAVLQGQQQAWGVELFLKRTLRKLEGWVSYTYSRSFVKVDGGEDWNSINNGEKYPTNYDIPNVLNVVLNYHFNRRVIFSTVVTYQTGKPVTYPVSVYYINGMPYLDYSKRNEYRLPDYFRTDMSLTLEGNLKKKKPLHSSLIFSVYNVTGRDNAYSVFFRADKGNIYSYKYSVISVPIFTITWLFKLGNYATE